jgi:uncharacterized protein (DUF952 family)
MAALDHGEHIFHLATAADWAEAERSGTYRTSTLGRSLDEEGFIHASRAAQVRGVGAAFYGDAGEPLVLLEIDPARLASEVRLEVPPGGDTAFPHIYGPLPSFAVVSATAYDVTSAD